MRIRVAQRRTLFTLVVCAIEVLIAATFLMVRASVPTVDRIDSWSWRWDDGVEVSSVAGDRAPSLVADAYRSIDGTPFGPGRSPEPSALIGYRRVYDVAGRGLDDWLREGLWTRSEAPAADGARWQLVVDCDCLTDLPGPRLLGIGRVGATVAEGGAWERFAVELGRVDAWVWLLLVPVLMAAMAWVVRRDDGWRMGYLVGAVGLASSAVVWDIGLSPTDLVVARPLLLLFAATGPMLLLFWSSVSHAMAQLPSRKDRWLARTRAVVALYAIPQAALAAGILVSLLVMPTPSRWVGTWMSVLGIVVTAMGVIALALVFRVRQRSMAGTAWRPALLCLPIAVVGVGGGFEILVGLVSLAAVLLMRPRATGMTRRDPRAVVVAVIALGAAAILIVRLGSMWGPALGDYLRLLPYGWLRPLRHVPDWYAIASILLGLAVLRYRVWDVDVLRDSRRRLVIAREEERRRLRRDLHDGLGPMLAAMTLSVDLVRSELTTDPVRADAALVSLKDGIGEGVQEVRRIIRDLRPPALDDLGFVEALRERIEDLATVARASGSLGDLEVSLGPLVELDAATQAAAYRITVEAVTNVIRHAHARTCIVRVRALDELEIEVADDGVGLSSDKRGGVGMTGMQDRAAELGGSCEVVGLASGGTLVRARLPLPRMPPAVASPRSR